ncbi:MAG: carbohydrate kinase family protein [Euryarchaeota archaeon]|nr:carbohydrate kinase family protein [Euryarchaeota archaeon]MBU4607544.1 carbohydrate kinase family protein [Euryarchaeota archaeon]MBV1728884.1 carbohydrate kinase family protein [Methanobacterium sp.]MBV1754141.1 carbohydrate kinase family protein [Methanobacterium sp.]
MSEKRDLLAIGHTAFDYIIQVGEFPDPNSSTAIEKMKHLHGGAAANVAVVGSRLGLNTSLVSAVGGDFAGSEYQLILDKLGIDTVDMIVVENDTTPTAFVLTNSNDDQISYFYWGAAKNFKDSEVPVKSINKTKAIHLATGNPQFNRRCGEMAREHGKLISFDPGQDLYMYSPQELKEVVGLCNILFGNHFEIDRIKNTLGMSLKEIMQNGPEIVVKTYGSRGSTIYAPEKIKIYATKSVVQDPTGAGDSYRAGFITAYLEDNNLEYCGRFASAVASFIIEAEGCQTNVPNYDMVKSRMEGKKV